MKPQALTPSRLALARATWLWAPILIFALVGKVHKLVRLAGGVSPAVLASIVASDLFCVALAWLITVTTAHLLKGRARTLVLALIHLVAALSGLLLGMEHGYFTATGAVPDGFMFKEMLTRWRDVRTAIGSEMNVWRISAMVLPFLYALVCVPLIVQRRARRAPPLPAPRRWYVPVVAVLALAIPGLFLHAPGSLHMLERNAIAGFTGDLVQSLGDESADWNALTVKPLEPLTLTRKPAKAKNLIVLLLESTSAKSTSLYGPSPYNPKSRTTPFLEELANKGAKVDRAYAVVPHTSKALVSVQCGIYPKFVPAVDESQPGGIPSPCMARLLREQGYATAFFQPAEENYEGRSHLIREFGFETFIGKESIDGAGFDEASYFGWEDDAMIRPIVEWAKKQKRPFYASGITLTTHHPYAIPRGYDVQPLAQERMLNDYLNSVSYADRFLRKLFTELEKAGLLQDTLVVVSGDHGEAFGEHGRYQHDTAVYEENVHVPMVLVGPGVVPGSTISGVRQLIDVLPTALDELGFVPSRALLGQNMLDSPGHDRIYVHCYFYKRCRAILENQRKYIDNYNQGSLEVYDLDKDPLEQKNLFGSGDALDHDARQRREQMDEIAGETNARYVQQSKARVRSFVSKSKPHVAKPLAVDFGTVEIVAADVSPSEIDVGGKVDVTVVYHVKESLPGELRTFMHVVGGRSWFNADHDPVGGAYPVSDWKVGDYIVDKYSVSTRPDHPMGDYEIATGFWVQGSGRLEPKSDAVEIDGQKRAHIGRFRVAGPSVDLAKHVLTAAPALPHPVDIRFGDGIALRSTVVDKPEIKGGLKVTLTYVFEVTGDMPPDASFEIRVRGPSSSKQVHVPVNGYYPLDKWERGQFIIDEHGIITRTRDRAGHYEVELILRSNGAAIPASGKGLELTPDGAIVGSYDLLPGSERL